MKFKGYNFPHPIVVINSFTATITENTNNLNIKSEKIDLSIFSTSIQDFISSKNADIICEIQCSDTFLRKIEFISEKFFFDFIIDKKLYRNKIEFEFTIVAKTNIEEFEVGERKYFLEKGDVICSLGKFSFGGGDGTIASLLKFNENKDNNEIRYSLENHYVIIEIPTKQFENIRVLKNNPSYSKIFISSIFQPSLIHICSFLDDDTYEGKEWFDFLREKWSAQNVGSIYPEKKEIPNFVQTLLNNPLHLLIDTLIAIEDNIIQED
jgi:hypothetical protein